MKKIPPPASLLLLFIVAFCFSGLSCEKRGDRQIPRDHNILGVNNRNDVVPDLSLFEVVEEAEMPRGLVDFVENNTENLITRGFGGITRTDNTPNNSELYWYWFPKRIVDIDDLNDMKKYVAFVPVTSINGLTDSKAVVKIEVWFCCCGVIGSTKLDSVDLNPGFQVHDYMPNFFFLAGQSEGPPFVRGIAVSFTFRVISRNFDRDVGFTMMLPLAEIRNQFFHLLE